MMTVGISVLLIIVSLFVFKAIFSFGIRLLGLCILACALCVTVWICTVKPDMHKPFSMSTIEYLLKVNKDGSVTTTKQITQTVINQNKGD